MNNIKVSASGRYGFRLEDVDGSVIFESKFHNVLTNEALYYLTSEDRIVSDFGVVAASKWTSLFGRCALGTGTSVSTPTDRTLTSPQSW